MNTAVHTRRGLRSWLGRRLEALQLAYSIKWAEQDRETLADVVERGPRHLRQLDRDLAEMRVRLALLRD
jgi:hypothetical protein